MCSALNKNRWFLFEKVKNYQYFATSIHSREKCDFFPVLGQKTGRAGQTILKLPTKRNQVFSKKNLENGSANQCNGGPVLKYFLSETIHAQENGSRGTHFAKFLISNFLKGLTYSAMWERMRAWGDKTLSDLIPSPQTSWVCPVSLPTWCSATLKSEYLTFHWLCPSQSVFSPDIMQQYDSLPPPAGQYVLVPI